jgi:hypothetical protein
MIGSIRTGCLLASLTLLAACSENQVSCGGKVSPGQIDRLAMVVVEKAKADSKAFCAGSPSGCDYAVATTPNGWSVAATRVFSVKDQCVSRIGDERFYSYDASGSLVRVLEGI